MSNRHRWAAREDVPEGIRGAIHRYTQAGASVPSLEAFQAAAAQAAREAVTEALERERIRWACQNVMGQFPAISRRDVFMAVALEFCLSEVSVRRCFYSTKLNQEKLDAN